MMVKPPKTMKIDDSKALAYKKDMEEDNKRIMAEWKKAQEAKKKAKKPRK